MKKMLLIASAVVLMLIGLSAFAQHHTKYSQKDIMQIAMHDKNLSIFVIAIKSSGLVDTLKGNGPFTVFAPSNAAFSKLPAGTLDTLLKDKKQLVAVLTYHVIPGEILSNDIQSSSVKTLEGQNITFTKDSSGVKVNDIKVNKADIKASNGVIHIIDTVLMPPASNQ